MSRLLVLAVLLAATAARADVWQRAIEPEPQLDVYAALLDKGDEAALAANAQGISLQLIQKQLEVSVEAYRAASKANPIAAEPYFRIAAVLYAFYFDCEGDSNNSLAPPPKTCGLRGQIHDQKARETVDAWDKFESISPLDPRVNEVLLSRAILRTKLVTSTPQPRPLLEAAAKDYQALLDREDGLLLPASGSGHVLVLGNLAETHMMLGNLDAAIQTYFAATKYGASSSTLYGLAVALDRDERTGDALQLIRAQGIEAYEHFQLEFRKNNVFFVPIGEEQYYFALCDEAFGQADTAIEHWKAFIVSKAHPQFQPRAKEHLDRLLARKNLRWQVPIVPDLTEPRLKR